MSTRCVAHRPHVWRAACFVSIAAMLLVLTACSMVRLAYNNADFVLNVLAREYLDVDGDEDALLREHIERLHEWHRREELPVYAALFQAAADKLPDGLTRQEVEWAIDNLRQRYLALAAQAADEAAPALAGLGPEHHAALEQKFADNNAKFTKEFLSGDEARRERARVKLLVGYFEGFTGSLTGEQQALIAAAVHANPRLYETRLESRKQGQGELLILLKRYRTATELAPVLRTYFLEAEQRRSADYASLARLWEQQMVQLLLDLDRTLSPGQRERAVLRLRGYAEDCRVLAREKQPPGVRSGVPVPAAG